MSVSIRKIFSSTNTIFQVINRVFPNSGNKYILSKMNSYGWCDSNKIENSDVVVVGWPKSGNTWFQWMLTSLLYGISAEALNDRIVKTLTPDIDASFMYKRIYPRMAFKTHQLPRKDFQKVIYLVRDGVDATLSLYRMQSAQGSMATKRKLCCLHHGVGWASHVTAWRNNPFNSEILFIRYEDLKRNTVSELEKVCVFLSLSPHKKGLQNIVEETSFDVMKNKLEEFGWDNTGNLVSPSTFMRKGGDDDTNLEVTDEEISEFRQNNAPALLLFNYPTK